jgi:hypothetical protein
VWLLAGAGIAAKWLLPIAPDGLTIGLYLGLGGLVIVPAAALVRAVGLRGLAWGAAGGLCDTAGAAGELARWPVPLPGVVGWHEVFHVWAMAGTALPVAFLVRCVVPFHRPAGRPAPARRWTGPACSTPPASRPASGTSCASACPGRTARCGRTRRSPPTA